MLRYYSVNLNRIWIYGSLFLSGTYSMYLRKTPAESGLDDRYYYINKRFLLYVWRAQLSLVLTSDDSHFQRWPSDSLLLIRSQVLHSQQFRRYAFFMRWCLLKCAGSRRSVDYPPSTCDVCLVSVALRNRIYETLVSSQLFLLCVVLSASLIRLDSISPIVIRTTIYFTDY